MYEGLPWLYLSGGACALIAGYRLRNGPVATGVSLSGLVAMVVGVTVWLRRRDSRARNAAYRGQDPPTL